ncbi:MAG TPA: glycyl-radical enzyme activating protein [Bacteroidales bacterium]|nr:glycyl-radical enzyme activating protein [Bacteroidales bacterium]
METEGIIFNIKRFSVHDGPGIRTGIFLKGCPLNCKWCHNPEGISGGISIWYNRNSCILCGECVASCPENALTLTEGPDPSIDINRSVCTVKGDCVRNCPTGSIDFTGMKVTMAEVMAEIRKDLVFYESSGGGVTLTGGEPFFQPDFCTGLLRWCRKEGLDTAVETCLYCEREILKEAAEYTCHFLVDLKIFDPGKHKEFTGKRNEVILDNLKFLSEMNCDITVRIPLIRGITDSPGNRRDIEEYVKSVSTGIPVEYLNFNPLTKNKYRKLGLDYKL